MKEYGHFIAGEAVKGTSGRFGDVFNPATGEVQAKVALAAAPRCAKRSKLPPKRSPPGPP